MSYGMRVRVRSANGRSQLQVLGGQVGVVGRAVVSGLVRYGSAIGAVTGIAAVNGALVLRDLAREMTHTDAVAATSPVTLTTYHTDLKAEALPIFRAGLEARGIAFAEGGTLALPSGSAPLAYTAVDRHGKVLFFVREQDGSVELVVAGDEVLLLVEEVLVESLMRLAEETLSQQGFRAVGRRSGGRWRMERAAPDGVREEVVFDYTDGQLTTKTSAFDRDNRLLEGNDCPDAQDFTAFFNAPDFFSLGHAPRRPRSGGDGVQAATMPAAQAARPRQRRTSR